MSADVSRRSCLLHRRELIRRALGLSVALPGMGLLVAGSTSVFGMASGKPQVTALAPGPTPTRGGTITVGLSSDATTLDPAFTTAQVDGQIFRAFFDSLMDVDDQLRLIPGLATSWRPLDDTTWEFKLRPSVKFHDGTLLDARAAKANFDRILDPKIGSPRRGEIPYVKDAEVVDPSTLRLHLTAPFAPLPYVLAGTSGIMVSPAAIDKYGKDLATNPVGTGPFAFVKWLKDDHIEGKAFPEYWRPGRPYLAGVRYQGIPDPQVKANAVRSGSIDITEGLLAKDIGALQKDRNLRVYARPGLSVTSLRLQLSKPPFSNRAIREALVWAIDRAAINKYVYQDVGAPARSFLPPTTLGYEATHNPFPRRDLDKARAKLSEGGQPRGFSFTAQILADPQITQLAEAMKQQLSDVGIEMQLVQLDNGTLLSRLVQSNFIATIIQYYGTLDPFQGFSRFFLSTSRLNVYGYQSRAFDDLLARSAATADVKARTAIYAQLNRMLASDLPWVFLHYPDYTQALRQRVEGYAYIPDGGMRLGEVWLKG